MSLEENKSIVRTIIEALNRQDLSSVDDLVAPDYVDHDLQTRGWEDAKKNPVMLYKGFPDFHMTIEDMIAEGDKVWVRGTTTGTHTGEFLGLAPTGKKFTITSVNIKRIVDGKMVEGWTVQDRLDFLKQLGVIEYTEEAGKLFPGEANQDQS